MSRELPAKPSLEYLRKQAKQLQRSMCRGKLADAQHALAEGVRFCQLGEAEIIRCHPGPSACRSPHRGDSR